MAKCGLLNLASCLPEKFFEFLVDIINAPIKPFLILTQSLLSRQIDLSLFVDLWIIIIYIISMFYAFLIIYSGFNFIISGYDSVRRENAKSWLRNVLIMIILVQSSFFLYELIVDLSAIMSSTVLNLINKNFFLITIDDNTSLGLALILGVFYLVVILLTNVILILRYAFVAIGVVFFPIAIFFYFIPPLRSYGSLIMNFLGVSIFITFFDAIALIGFSKLVEIFFFSKMKILVMISAFLFIDIMMILLLFFSIIKAGLNLYIKGGAIAKQLS